MKTKKKSIHSLVTKVDTDWAKKIDSNIENSLEREVNAIIALKLVKHMKSNGLTQKDVADRLGISPQYVNRIVKGRVNLSVGKAVRYGELLNVKLIERPQLIDSKTNKVETSQPTIKVNLKLPEKRRQFSDSLNLSSLKATHTSSLEYGAWISSNSDECVTYDIEIS